MPAQKFTRKARSKVARRQWQHVYESAKSRGASEGSAIRQASGVIKKRSQKGKRTRSGNSRKRSRS